MKMVLVFDTDDMAGMKSCLKIFKQLAKERGLDSYMANADDPKFGKIEFIKMIKDFDAFGRLPDIERNSDGGNITLRSLKEFTDQVWEQKRTSGYYKTKWTRR